MQISADIRTTMGVCKEIIGKIVAASRLWIDAKNVANLKKDNGPRGVFWIRESEAVVKRYIETDAITCDALLLSEFNKIINTFPTN